MKKKIGITCDDYKADKFRKGLLKAGFTLEYDGESGVNQVHLFRVEVPEKDFNSMQEKIGETISRIR